MKKFQSLFLFLLILASSVFAAGNLDSAFNASVTEGLGGVSRTLTQPDGKILAFGSFQRANGARLGNIARFNADGSLDTTFSIGSGANGSVAVAVLQTDNKIIIGGNFTLFNGVTVNRLARLNADGSLDPSFSQAANFTGFVHELVIQPDGKILVAGATSSATSAPSRIVRLSSDGSVDSSFQTALTTGGNVYTMTLMSDGRILVGGSFISIGGSSKTFLARLNTDGTVDNGFSASTMNDTINKIVIQPDGKLLLAASSMPFGAKRLNADGSDPNPVSKSAAPSVIVYAGYDVALLPDGKVLVAYGVGSGIITHYYVHRLNADLSLDESFQSSTPDYLQISDINLLADGKFIIGGSFVSFNGQPRLHIARVNPNGALDSSFNAAISVVAQIRTIKAQPDGKILVGGLFEYVNGVRRTNLARINADGSLDEGFSAPPDLFDFSPNYIMDIELQSDGKIIVARYIFNGGIIALTDPEGGISNGGVIRLNADGSLDKSFATMSMGLMRSLAVDSSNNIFVGGGLNNPNPPFASATFGKLLPNGAVDNPFFPAEQPLGAINRIIVQPDGKILVAGVFSTVGGNAQVGTVRYNANGTRDSSYFSTLPNINALGLAGDGKIYVGGNFPINGGNVNTNFARLRTDGSIDNTFVGLANAQVRDLIVQADGKIIIGGDFTQYYSNSVGRIARINPTSTIDSTFNTGTGASGSIYALERQPDGKILVGGQFLDFNGVEKLSLVRLQNVNQSTRFDFDGDAKSDLSIFRPSNGEWWYQRSSNNQVAAAQFGASTDHVVPADFSGDGKTDLAFWRPVSGEWFILRSENNSFYSVPFGLAGDIPAPADFDSDGKDDPAVFRPSSGTWFINKSAGGTDIINFGQAGDVPTVGDYDGDGKADIAIFRPASGEWWINRSTSGVVAVTFGTSTDKPVAGDFTGDGKTDIAFWRPSNGFWFILRSEDSSFYSVPFGASGDIPAAGDFDGDGKFDTAVFRPNGSTWYINRSTAGLLIQQFGLATDTPVPSAFVP